MPLDYDHIMAVPPILTEHRLTTRDTILYALGVGAEELRFVYEDGLQALPTMATIMAYPGFFQRWPEYGLTWQKLLHGEQSIELHQPLPVEGDFLGETVIEEIFDRGADKGAILIFRRTIRHRDGGELVATSRSKSFLRADGGFGQRTEETLAPPHPAPDRPCDEAVSLQTRLGQAALYRLSGDYNPLHIDPRVARAGGFDRPILHGLCAYGMVGRALIRTLCDNDGARLKRMDVRFSKPVYPGETIRTEIWREAAGRAAFRAFAAERDELIINNGYVEFA